MLTENIREKLQGLCRRYQELILLLSDLQVIDNQEEYRRYSKEYASVDPIVQVFKEYEATVHALSEARLLENDPEMMELALGEIKTLGKKEEELLDQLHILLIPKDPEDECNVFLEVRAGTGGSEAAIFAGDLFRMYAKYAENRGWGLEIISSHESEQGGYKEIIAKVTGHDVYSRLKFESGAHRVQRVPETETQGRIHTSACTVAILPELTEITTIELNPQDLRVDTYRASGAGGQHVNKTDSAIRITHLPTGIVVECQEERSQHKNRSQAMSLLKTRILSQERERQRKAQAEKRKSLVGSGDRSERIRTYNFPQGRLTDHRIHLTLYSLDRVMEGELDPVIEPLIQQNQADLLSEGAERSSDDHS